MPKSKLAAARIPCGLAAGFLILSVQPVEVPQDAEEKKEAAILASREQYGAPRAEVEVESHTTDNLPPNIPDEVRASLPKGGKVVVKAEIKTQHPRYSANDEIAGSVEFDVEESESQGTQKFIALSGPLYHTIEEGSILVVDEFEARLHPPRTAR